MAKTARAPAARPARKAAHAASPARQPAELSAGVGAKSLVLSLAQQLQSWAGSMLSRVGDASDTALTLAAARTQGPGRKAAVEKAAGLLRDLRQAAGL